MSAPSNKYSEEELKERSRKANARKREIANHRTKHLITGCWTGEGVEHPDTRLTDHYKAKRYF